MFCFLQSLRLASRATSRFAKQMNTLREPNVKCAQKQQPSRVSALYLRFFFCPCRPKRKSLAKRKRPGESFARCDARGGLRALHLRHLAVGLQSAVARRVAILCNTFYSSATIRSLPVGRGFEEVHERSGHKLKSAPHERRTKTPLRRTKKGSALFALPSEGSNPFCLGSF